MQPMHEGLEIIDFEYSQSIVQKQYCVETGDLAGEGCPRVMTGWYKISKIPDVCTDHADVHESEETDEPRRSSDRENPRHNINGREEYDPWA